MTVPRGWVQLGGPGGVLSLPLIVLAATFNVAGSSHARRKTLNVSEGRAT